MKELREELSQLIALAQIHLAQEYKREEWCISDQNTYESFRAFALRNKPHKGNVSREQIPVQKPPSSPSSKSKLLNQHSLEKKETDSFEKKSDDVGKKRTKQAENVSQQPKPALELQKPSPPCVDDFRDIRKTMKKLFPNQMIIEEVPDVPSEEKAAAPEAIVLYGSESAQDLSFLANLAKAIQLCLCPTAAINKDGNASKELLRAGSVRMVIGKESDLQELALDYPSVSAFTLAPIENYLQKPECKAELWKEICEAYRKLSMAKDE